MKAEELVVTEESKARLKQYLESDEGKKTIDELARIFAEAAVTALLKIPSDVED